MNAYLALTFLIVSVFAEEQNEKRAIVVLQGTTVTGNVTFIQNGPNVNVVGVIQGLTPGKHGFHIHEKGDLSSGCASTGGHFNPYKKHHGGPNDTDRHVGDLGNIIADESGIARFTIIDKIISLTGECSIVGRGVVVHSDADDLGKGGHPDSLTTGHAGSRVACGVIGTLDLITANAASTISVSILFLPLLSTAYFFV